VTGVECAVGVGNDTDPPAAGSDLTLTLLSDDCLVSWLWL